MLAIIETGGKQYKVSEGLILDIESLDVSASDTVTFEQVLLVSDGVKTDIGQPYVAKATVLATVLENLKAPKVTNFKFKPKTGYKKTKGHRQNHTRVKITTISSGLAEKE